ncbi:MAG: CoA-binding protein [Myxococcota bacterium]
MDDDQERLRRILTTCRTIAVLGASGKAGRPANYVPTYLVEQGYCVLPVNPLFAGQLLFGVEVRSTLFELRQPVDLVDVFRRSDVLPEHIEEILAMRPLPKVVWLQSGIRHEGFARSLQRHGIEVVEDRCTLAEHRRLVASER